MTLWRISEHADLKGTGGLLASARWHTQGRRIVYCAENPATSLLEILVHIDVDPEDLVEPLEYLEIGAPDNISLQTLNSDALERDWRIDLQITRRAGDQWLASGETALLRVPSVVAPATWNVLVNPQHPQAAMVRIVNIHRHSIDPRFPG